MKPNDISSAIYKQESFIEKFTKISKIKPLDDFAKKVAC